MTTTAAAKTDNATLDGVALRDWFAGQALVGLIPAPALPGVSRLTLEGMAESAYEHADAMLRARAKPAKT